MAINSTQSMIATFQNHNYNSSLPSKLSSLIDDCFSKGKKSFESFGNQKDCRQILFKLSVFMFGPVLSSHRVEISISSMALGCIG